MSPPIAREIAGLVRRGYLDVRAGHIDGVETSARLARVSYRPRGGRARSGPGAARDRRARRDCGRRSAGSARHAADRARPRRLDRHRLWLDVTPELQAIGRSGAVTPGLWALGPLVRGVFWECTAVAEVRVQAAELAGHVEAALGEPDLARAS